MSIDHPVVLTTLVDELSISSLLALDEALAHPPWPGDALQALWGRMALKRQPHPFTMMAIRERMRGGKRCAHCAVLTRRRPNVCKACACNEESEFAMWTREDVRARYRIRALERRMREELVSVKRSSTGCMFYWKSDVIAAFGEAR